MSKERESNLIGSLVIMSHSERQKFLKTSGLAKIFGVDHLLPEVEEDIKQPRIPGVLKGSVSDTFWEPLPDEELKLWSCVEKEDD